MPGLEEGRGYSFFTCYGSNVGPMWRVPRRVAGPPSASADREIVSAAVETFKSLGDWLNDAIR